LNDEGLLFPDSQEVLSTTVGNVDLGVGDVNVTLRAINKLLERSRPLLYNLTVDTAKPVKDGKCKV
jgi:hypothetical protein